MRKYADFGGRARRKEYWMFQLVSALVFMALVFIALGMERSPISALKVATSALPLLYCLATGIPTLAVTVRRFHDIGRSGWWYFICFIPIAGTIIFIVFVCTDGEPRPNLWGPSPKYAVTPYGYPPYPPG
jgi:uncharacterized membrane protein YhaH (DUF805 family)